MTIATRPLVHCALTASLFCALAACHASGGKGDGGINQHDMSAPPGSDLSGTNHDGGMTSMGTLVGPFIGVDGFPNNTLMQLAPFGSVREYHDWQWCEGNSNPAGYGYPNNLNDFTLFPFDMFYSSLSALGVSVNPAIQGGVPWINGGAVPPVAAGADPTKAASYIAHGDQLYQYAARYGAVKVPDANLKLVSGNTRSTGLGYLHYYEDFNEEDAYWNNGGQPIMSAADFAAMASADYDGDQSRLGATIGVHNADPNAMLVMGGLSGDGAGTAWSTWVTSYFDGMRTWVAANRTDGKFPADVLNMHHYCFNPNNTGPAQSPEDGNLQMILQVVTNYRDAHLPGVPLWLSEFGYDTDPSSVLRAPAIGASSQAIVQAQWIIRSYLAILAAGFDRAHLFEIEDNTCTGSACSVQFATSGVIDSGGTPKPAYYFIAAFHARLASMRYVSELDSGMPNVKVYSFQSATDDSGAYVVWAPTSNGTSDTTGYMLSVASDATSAQAVVLADQQLMGNESTLTITGAKVSVDVTETPTIVLVDRIH
jgi:hypothetical protein